MPIPQSEVDLLTEYGTRLGTAIGVMSYLINSFHGARRLLEKGMSIENAWEYSGATSALQRAEAFLKTEEDDREAAISKLASEAERRE